jgi:hypothetical protein
MAARLTWNAPLQRCPAIVVQATSSVQRAQLLPWTTHQKCISEAPKFSNLLLSLSNRDKRIGNAQTLWRCQFGSVAAGG